MPAPSATTPAPDQAPFKLVAATIDRYKLELDPILSEMGWSKDDRDWYCNDVFPSTVRLRYGLGPQAADNNRIAHLAPKKQAGDTSAIPSATLNLVYGYVKYGYEDSLLVWNFPDSTYPRGYDAMPEGLKPGLVRLHIVTRQRRLKLATAPISADRIAADLAATLAEPAFQGENARMVARVIGRINRRDADLTALARAADLYAARADADPWFADYFRGVIENQTAWQERGNDTAANTEPTQFKGFFKHLEKAESFLTSAHKRKPQWPEAADIMINVARGQEGKGDDSPKHWYEQAVAADPLDADAFHFFAVATASQWAGNDGPALAATVIRAAAGSTDHSTSIPVSAVTALLAAFPSRHDLTDALRLQDLYEPAKKALGGYLTSENPGVRPDLARTWLMLLAYHANRPADAMAVFNSKDFQPREPDTVADIAPQGVQLWAVVNSSAKANLLHSAEDALSAGSVDGACTLYAKALAELPPGPDADLARSRIALTKRLQRALAGAAANLCVNEKEADGSPANAMALWPAVMTWNVQTTRGPDGATLAFGKEEYRTRRSGHGAVYFPVPLNIFKNGFELSFDAVFDDEGKPYGSIGYIGINRTPPDGQDDPDSASAELRFDRVSFQGRRSNAPPVKPDLARLNQPQHSSRHTVRLLVDGANAELWRNGELADWSIGTARQAKLNPGAAWLSFGGDALGRGELRYENITIKALDKPLEKRAPPKKEPARPPAVVPPNSHAP